jgi:hypothetical protein
MGYFKDNSPTKFSDEENALRQTGINSYGISASRSLLGSKRFIPNGVNGSQKYALMHELHHFEELDPLYLDPDGSEITLDDKIDFTEQSDMTDEIHGDEEANEYELEFEQEYMEYDEDNEAELEAEEAYLEDCERWGGEGDSGEEE